MYDALTDKGYRVFFSRITLEEKLGVEYEPYIFAALNSAKIMLAFGTDYEYFNAVWVKNEWSRFLKLMAKDKEKHLIPCYKGIDAYDMPSEFAKLQAQDLGKVGAMQDLLRGIEKIIPRQNEAAKETVVVQQSSPAAPGVDSLLERAFMFLEDGAWNDANTYCEKVLDIDPKNARAYLGKLMAELRIKKQESLKDCEKPFDGSNHYQKALRFADDALKATITGYIDHINTRNENARLESTYSKAKNTMATARTEQACKEAAKLFESIRNYQDSADLAKKCYEKAEIARKDSILAAAKSKATTDNIFDYMAACELLVTILGWKDADVVLEECREKIHILKALADQQAEAERLERERQAEELKRQEEAERLEQERQAELARQKAAKKAKRKKVTMTVVGAIVAIVILLNTLILPLVNYNNAVNLLEEGNTRKAAILFGKARYYRDAKKQSSALWDQITERKSIDIINGHAIGVMQDGTVVAVGDNDHNQCNVDAWRDIVAVNTGGNHVVGLKSDGTVVAVGCNEDGRCDLDNWRNIVAISAGYCHTIGLKADGTVVSAGNKGWNARNVQAWKDIVAIDTGDHFTIGLTSNGTVVIAGTNYYQNLFMDVSNWTDIVAISVGTFHITGLKSDGTVVAVGDNDSGECNVNDWKDIVAISAAADHTVGLKSDGTVVAVGDNGDGECNVGDWKDIVAISAGDSQTIGLKQDGSIMAVGDNDDGQCDVSGWTDIRVPN